MSDLKKLDEGSSKSFKLGSLVYHSILKDTVFFLFWPKKIFCRFYEFLKTFGLRKKNRKITLLAINNTFFHRFS
jgi:hypothetical protein